MATRMIVTSQPDVACDVCGRRLLRGEQPDVFLAGGRRRMVCELCAPRASAEGWLRETDRHSLSLPPSRPRRGRSLLDRLRAQRERADPAGETELSELAEMPQAPGEASYGFYDGDPRAAKPLSHGGAETARPVPAFSDPTPAPVGETTGSGEVTEARAVDVFNASEHPRRIAGVARSLGAPSVCVRAPAESGSVMTIVVAWELSWYRYEVDLADETAGASVAAQGTELSELADEDLLANAVADAEGALSLIGFDVR